jgi:lipoate-protein ligase A
MWIDDLILARCREEIACSIWSATQPMVVLGSSNQPERECNLSNCRADEIPVLKRYGGGGTVLLYPGVVVLSLGLWVRLLYHNGAYFQLLNGALIDALAAAFPLCARLQQRGLSDIADGERKIAGTSMFRSRHYLLYQVSLLVDADLAPIERYIAHPSSEPEYRSNKTHRDFLGCLVDLVPGVDSPQVVEALEQHFQAMVRRKLEEEMVAPDLKHCEYLLQKANGI